jgi:hypothetical protein
MNATILMTCNFAEVCNNNCYNVYKYDDQLNIEFDIDCMSSDSACYDSDVSNYIYETFDNCLVDNNVENNIDMSIMYMYRGEKSLVRLMFDIDNSYGEYCDMEYNCTNNDVKYSLLCSDEDIFSDSNKLLINNYVCLLLFVMILLF